MKSRIINLVILAVSLAATIAFVVIAPDRVPMHFDVNGIVDRWGSKYEMFILPFALLLLQLLGEFTVSKFRKIAESSEEGKVKSDAETNVRVLNIVFPVIFGFMFIINIFSMYQSYSQLDGVSLPKIGFEKVLAVLFGILFMILGNFMTKTRTNGVIGFRHVWTAYNDVTWRKSNRFAGYVMVASGFLTLLSGIIFFRIIPVLFLLGTMIVSIVIIMIYAYKVYMEERTKNDEISEE